MRFKFILIPLLLVVVVALAAAAHLLFLRTDASTPSDTSTGGGYQFPIASSTGSSQTSMTINGIEGIAITVRDFIHNDVTVADIANEGTYFLAGSNGLCDDAGNCPRAGTYEDFTIVYFSQDQSFSVSLNREPLGEVRRAAENYLMQTLGIPQLEMCALKYMVGTTVYVNPVYGSIENLGFSYCPGATKLP